MASAHFSRRAWRRHHRDRLKQARKGYWSGPHPEWGAAWEGRRLGMLAQNPKPCSCWMCGSPRRVHGNAQASLTFQELRARCVEREGLEEAEFQERNF